MHYLNRCAHTSLKPTHSVRAFGGEMPRITILTDHKFQFYLNKSDYHSADGAYGILQTENMNNVSLITKQERKKCG